MKTKLISVIMPVWNAPKIFFEKAVQSILNQDYKNFELIIVEDPSSNTQISAIKQFNDSRIKYFLNSNRTNFVEQLNKGVELAQGEVIARMDADDIAELNRLSRQLDFLISNPKISLVGSNLTIIDKNNKIIGTRKYPEKPSEIAKKMKISNVIAHPTIIFYKKDFQEIGGYKKEFGLLADYDLLCLLSLKNKKFYNLQEPLLKYRMHYAGSKNYELKKQLQDTIRIKQKYFRFKLGWTIFAEVRILAEFFLLLLPSKLVYKLFKATNIKATSNQ